MAKSFLLEIVTPEKLFYYGEADIVIARTLTGEEGYMAGHIWACNLLETGELWFRESGSKDFKVAAISGGFVDVRDYILVFTD
ncbi:MAG: F0F1 ATP synthase subunit delta, partial [Clostridiales bacterium]|nr:F0F1 ATP synthase subunit delta [Clostridiales bacterium]